VGDLNKLYADFALVADFLTVYISEAHSQDEWPMGDLVLIDQPKSDAVRCEVARQFVYDSGFMIPMVVDSIENQFDDSFGAWPVRFFIVQNGRVVFKAQPNEEFGYDLGEVRAWLDNRFADF